jgi:hypothetical protein
MADFWPTPLLFTVAYGVPLALADTFTAARFARGDA